MENLRDKLNSVPQDFDREKLWRKIEPKKKKKRRFLWIWFLPLFLGAYLIMSKSVNSPQRLTETLGDSELQNGQFSSTLSNKNIILDETIEDKLVQNQPTIRNETAKTKATSDLDSTPTEVENEVYSAASMDMSDGRIRNELSKIRSETLFQSSETLFRNARLISANTVINDKLTVKEDQTQQNTHKESINIEAISSLEFHQFLKTSIEEIDLSQIRDLQSHFDARANSERALCIKLAIGLGSDRHLYSDASRRNENELESIFSTVSVSRQISKHLSLIGGLSYSRNTTNVRYSKEGSIVSLTDGTLTNENYMTTYNLYNNYTRLDASLGLSSSYHIGRFILYPSVGLGYNLSSKADGEYLDSEGQFITLSSLDYKESTGVFGQLGVDVSYILKKNIHLGISGNIQSLRNLNDTENHRIRPVSLGFFVKKVI